MTYWVFRMIVSHKSKLHIQKYAPILESKGAAVNNIIKEKTVTLESTADVEEYERIFERYLEICKQALEKNKDKFPYTEIWKARWKKMGRITALIVPSTMTCRKLFTSSSLPKI